MKGEPVLKVDLWIDGVEFWKKKNWYGGSRRKRTSLQLITKYIKYIQTVDNGERTAYLAPVDRVGCSYLQRLKVSVGRLPWKPVGGLQGPGGRGLWGWRCNSGELNVCLMYLNVCFCVHNITPFIIKHFFPQMWKWGAERVHILSTYSPLNVQNKRKSLMLSRTAPPAGRSPTLRRLF